MGGKGERTGERRQQKQMKKKIERSKVDEKELDGSI